MLRLLEKLKSRELESELSLGILEFSENPSRTESNRTNPLNTLYITNLHLPSYWVSSQPGPRQRKSFSSSPKHIERMNGCVIETQLMEDIQMHTSCRKEPWPSRSSP